MGWIARLRSNKRRQHPFFRCQLRACLHILAAALLDQCDADLEQIAHDLVDVAADIADLGEFRRLDLEKRRIGKFRQPSRNLGLAAAGWADHQDIFGQHLFAHRALELQPAPAIAQSHRNGALRVILPNDIAIELGNDFARRKISHFC